MKYENKMIREVTDIPAWKLIKDGYPGFLKNLVLGNKSVHTSVYLIHQPTNLKQNWHYRCQRYSVI